MGSWFTNDAGSPSAIHFRDEDMLPHRPYERHEPRNPRPWDREVGRVGEHRLTQSRDGTYREWVPVHGANSLGKLHSDREALAIWHGHLRAMGVNF